ncbi:hypothetical protein DNTS_028770 [Danionella cerebrum]|uniref:Neurochondrin n=1 Tax=Danionella cerebrum TaxID=2873325 RepID=A0A553QVG0_9TELE|nr:hypothetical protein DNTS_028770 [Danionella translucida]
MWIMLDETMAEKQTSEGPESASKGPGSASEGPGSASEGPGSASEGPGSASEGPGSTREPSGLTPAQSEVLERCLHALTHAQSDSHILAALLLITRLCPAGRLDPETLHRIFSAVGLRLPARLLATAFQDNKSSGLPPEELISLGTALLAALSTNESMVSHPQLLSTVPLILKIVENGGKKIEMEDKTSQSVPETKDQPTSDTKDHSTSAAEAFTLDEALSCDCYQVLNAVCVLPQGPEQLFSRGAITSLCRAVLNNQTLSHEKGLPLLGILLGSNMRLKAWDRHASDLLLVLKMMSQNFCEATKEERLEMCSQISLFLPPPGIESQSLLLKDITGGLWLSIQPLIQSKIKQEHLGPVLVLSACLLDLFGWESVGPPKFCCLLVNRACVEVRMGLEEPPGTEISLDLQHTLTACYRIMEAAMEQACSQGLDLNAAQKQTSVSGLSLQQSRQVLRVLEEAFHAEIYHLRQVQEASFNDPFVFATFRSLCVWLAEETSCMRDAVIDLLPFLIQYAKSHFKGGAKQKGLCDWMTKMSISYSAQDGTWSGDSALRYLLPALCHLSAEDEPRRVLLSLDTPALLVEFLSKAWMSLRSQSGKAVLRDPSLETACSALLNFTITEPERVRLRPPSKDCVDPAQRRFFSSVLSFLFSAVQSSVSQNLGIARSVWDEHWEEAGELWRLSVQALTSCVQNQPWISSLLRDEGYTSVSGFDWRPDEQASVEALQGLLGIAH